MENQEPPEDGLSSSQALYIDGVVLVPVNGASNFGENFTRTLLQRHYNWAILNGVKLCEALNSLRSKASLAELQKQLTNFATSLTHYVHGNPWEAVFALLCVAILLTVPVILPAIGFGALGPTAGSLAAAWQSYIGIVAAGSPFAFLQGAAMGGAAAGWIIGAGAAGLGALVVKKTAEWTQAVEKEKR